MTALLFLIWIILFPIVCLSWSRVLFKILKIKNTLLDSLPYQLLIGIFLTNYIGLILKSFGLAWWLVSLVLVLAIFFTYEEVAKLIEKTKLRLSFNLVFWTALILVTGISIFDAVDGIQTIWTSNYGDLAFHFGMITSFAFGDNIYPEYHIYPGLTLSYPFLVNFWTALLWWVNPNWIALSYVFLYQWIIVWLLVYFIVNGEKHKLVPWAILLGGGTYILTDTASAEMIDMGLFWTRLLETAWIPQRSTLFGVLLLVSSLSLFFRIAHEKEYQKKSYFIILGILLAFFPLAHTHFWIISAAVIWLGFAFQLLNKNINFKNLIYFVLPQVLYLIPIYLLSSKTSILDIKYGYITGKAEDRWYGDMIIADYLNPYLEIIFNWLANWSAVFIFLIILFFIVKKRIYLFIFCFLFLAGNFVNLSYWEYDQVKFFVGLYLLLLMVFNYHVKAKDGYGWVLIILLTPGIYNLGKVMFNTETLTVYTKEQLQHAQVLRESIEPDSIIVSAPDHNSTVTLSGRKLYAGYLGTLWTHGINYQDREKILRSLRSLEQCSDANCPKYLYWNHNEKRYWKRSVPGVGSGTEYDYIYVLK